MLGIVVERLSHMAATDPSKKVVVKSIPSSTIDFLLSCIEKHCAIKDEVKSIVVSSEFGDLIFWNIDGVFGLSPVLKPAVYCSCYIL